MICGFGMATCYAASIGGLLYYVFPTAASAQFYSLLSEIQGMHRSSNDFRGTAHKACMQRSRQRWLRGSFTIAVVVCLAGRFKILTLKSNPITQGPHLSNNSPDATSLTAHHVRGSRRAGNAPARRGSRARQRPLGSARCCGRWRPSRCRRAQMEPTCAQQYRAP